MAGGAAVAVGPGGYFSGLDHFSVEFAYMGADASGVFKYTAEAQHGVEVAVEEGAAPSDREQRCGT